MSVYKLGLTGSIGMGKSTTVDMFREAGVPVFDSDAVVHALYGPGGDALPAMTQAFPDCIEDGVVSRTRLSAHLAENPADFDRLNAIVHPLVAEKRAEFLRQAEADNAPLVVFDIPLLFETGSDRMVDGILVVTAPENVQRERVLSRPGMTPSRLDQILARQTPDDEKRRRADFIIDTSKGMASARKSVEELIAKLKPDSKPA